MNRRRLVVLFASLLLAAFASGCKKSTPPGTITRGGPTGGGAAAGGSGSTTGDAAGGSSASTDGDAKPRPRLAYVTNGPDEFWNIAERGAMAAAKDFDCDVVVQKPAPDSPVSNQQRMIEEQLALNVDGIAVSPIDPDNQLSFLNSVAERTRLITHDADAPQTKRLAYVGMKNYLAGRMCGKLVKEAMPEGGSIMIFVGRLEQLNARERRQGLIDELLDRSIDESRFDENGQEIKGDKYTILDTRTDRFDGGAAQSNAEDAIARYPDLGCMIGLFAYNPPKIIEALRGAEKLGKIKVVGFDEDESTLQAIKDGYCFGTVVQNPYQYGYQSVRILAALTRGDQSALPEGGFLNIDAQSIKKDNVDKFWTELKQLKKKSDDPGSTSSEAKSE